MAEYGFSDAFLKQHSDVKSVVDKAIAGQWEMDKFLDSLRQTSWWKKTSDAQRRYDVQLAENPGEINEAVLRQANAITRLAAQMGYVLNRANVVGIARAAVRNNLNEEEIRNWVGLYYRRGGNQGMIGQARGELNRMAGDYGIKLSTRFMDSAIEQVVRGLRTTDSYREWIKDSAKQQYKAVAPQLDQGYTVRQILDPYLAVAAEELGKNAATFDISNPMWNAAIQHRGAKGTEPVRTMTNDEWLSKVRTDKRYGWDSGQNAQKAAAVMTRELATAFGAM